MDRMTSAEYRKLALQKTAKYRNEPITTPDGWFQSKGEYSRWVELKLLERKGLIKNLKRQTSYRLTDKTRGQRSVFWRPDYQYIENGISTVEDFKSPATAKITAFRNKVKMFKQRYPEIRVMVSTSDIVQEFK